MTDLLHELVLHSAARSPDAVAIRYKNSSLTYADLAHRIEECASGLSGTGLSRLARVAIYLPKCVEAVVAMFATTRAGGAFVPINPLLKPEQVAYILRDCNVQVLVTSDTRARDLAAVLRDCPELRLVVLTDGSAEELPTRTMSWRELAEARPSRAQSRNIDLDMAAIFYTSGSTGKPKGVVLSHRSMVTGAESVAQYLGNTPEDRLLTVLPFSFDYGFSQLSTAFRVGAAVALFEYLLPRDVLRAVERERITGLAGVPPVWSQLADLQWPEGTSAHLRYITNSGGAMPRATLDKLRTSLPGTKIFLMYGLTEAFRSTYLPPEEIDHRPDSIGKAIPNAEILVVRPDGTPCEPNEPGELVHRGSLVGLGYWNDPGKTAERYKPLPGQDPGLVITELAVWSGDTVRMDEEGFLYFVGRRDEMIKTSGYRVSPTEIEEVLYATGMVSDAVALGVPHPRLGQAIAAVLAPVAGTNGDSNRLLEECRRRLPTYMVPLHVEWRRSLPRNPNGKFDRPRLAAELAALFESGETSIS